MSPRLQHDRFHFRRGACFLHKHYRLRTSLSLFFPWLQIFISLLKFCRLFLLFFFHSRCCPESNKMQLPRLVKLSNFSIVSLVTVNEVILSVEQNFNLHCSHENRSWSLLRYRCPEVQLKSIKSCCCLNSCRVE